MKNDSTINLNINGDTRLIQTTKNIKKERQQMNGNGCAHSGDFDSTPITRQVIFVNPDDDDESAYWWPGLIVPRIELAIFKATMDNTVQDPAEDEDLVVYFEDASFSLVPKSDQRPFDPQIEPFTIYMSNPKISKAFQADRAVQLALQYLRTGYLPKAFKWVWKKTNESYSEEEEDGSADEPKRKGRRKVSTSTPSGNPTTTTIIDTISDQIVISSGRKRRRTSVSSPGPPPTSTTPMTTTKTKPGRKPKEKDSSIPVPKTTKSPIPIQPKKESTASITSSSVVHLIPPSVAHLVPNYPTNRYTSIGITSNGVMSTTTCTSCGSENAPTLIDHYLCIDCSMCLDNMLDWRALNAGVIGGPSKHKHAIRWLDDEDEQGSLHRIIGYGVMPLTKRQRLRLLADGVDIYAAARNSEGEEEDEEEDDHL